MIRLDANISEVEYYSDGEYVNTIVGIYLLYFFIRLDFIKCMNNLLYTAFVC